MANTLDQRILALIKKYMEKLTQKKVLTSMEEVEANTNETNLVAAPVVAELNNKLMDYVKTEMVVFRGTTELAAMQGVSISADYHVPADYEILCGIPGYSGSWQIILQDISTTGRTGNIIVHGVLQNNWNYTSKSTDPYAVIFLRKI